MFLWALRRLIWCEYWEGIYLLQRISHGQLRAQILRIRPYRSFADRDFSQVPGRLSDGTLGFLYHALLFYDFCVNNDKETLILSLPGTETFPLQSEMHNFDTSFT